MSAWLSADCSPQTPWLRILALLALLAALALAIAQGWDARFSPFWAGLGQERVGRTWAAAAYVLGLGGVQMAAMALVALVGYLRGRRSWLRLGRDGLLAVAASGLASQVVKHLVGRPRPRMNSPAWEALGPSFDSDLHSFPSGHAATSFALAVVLSRRWPSLSPLFYLGAAAVAWGRVVGGSHYPSDALAGAALGLLVGWPLAQLLHRPAEGA